MPGLALAAWLAVKRCSQGVAQRAHARTNQDAIMCLFLQVRGVLLQLNKLTWLVLGGDLAARSHRVEQLTAL